MKRAIRLDEKVKKMVGIVSVLRGPICQEGDLFFITVIHRLDQLCYVVPAWLGYMQNNQQGMMIVVDTCAG